MAKATVNEEEDQAEPSTPPDIEVELLGDDTPVRELEPIAFFGPHGAPVADKDFRPVTTLFKNDEPVEDGHGNFQRPNANTPVHPSTPRESYPYEGVTTEGQEASDEGESTQGSPFVP